MNQSNPISCTALCSLCELSKVNLAMTRRVRQFRNLQQGKELYCRLVPSRLRALACSVITDLPAKIFRRPQGSRTQSGHHYNITTHINGIMPRKSSPKTTRSSDQSSPAKATLPLSAILNCPSCISTSVSHSQCKYHIHDIAHNRDRTKQAILSSYHNCMSRMYLSSQESLSF
jgi:hypothetical protein